ncbi:MAG: hypothetical protein ACYDBZ_11660 [Steroidobacteraceae bacterium]
MVKHCVLLLALAAAHSAAASPSKAHARTESDKFAAWTAQAAQVLGARADANSLATAAALTITRSEPAALDLAARASELAPQNSAIGWLRLQLCALAPACDMRDIATVMRWVDPDNAAAWLPTLAVAERDKDTTEVDRVLADMAREPHFDLHWNRIVVFMFDALDAARNELPDGYAGSDSARYTAVIGIAGGEVIPPFAPLVDACRESAAHPERRDLCLRLAKTMQRGDTIVAQLAGFGIEKRLLASDSKEVRAIAERRRVLEWRAAAAARFDNPLLPWTKNARARARLAQMRALPREEDVCMAILREHKMAVDPPEVHP